MSCSSPAPKSEKSLSPEPTSPSEGLNQTQTVHGDGNLNAGRDINLTMETKQERLATFFQLDDDVCNSLTLVGRNDLLKELHSALQDCATKKLSSERIVVLCGLNGIGKSAIARGYVNNFKDDPIIQNVAWINAENEQSLRASFAELSQELGISVQDKTGKVIARHFYRHFSKSIKSGLLIFDNPGQLDTILPFLPQQTCLNKPLILITTCISKWDRLVQDKTKIIYVDELNEECSVELLNTSLKLTQRQRKDEIIQTAIQNLASSMHGFPLGLTAAASYFTIEEWIDIPAMIEKFIVQLKALRPRSETDCEAIKQFKNVWNATLVKFESMGDGGRDAILLLNILSYFPSDDIKKHIVESIFLLKFPDADMQNGFSILKNHSMIAICTKKDKHEKKYFQIKIHQLVQLCTRQRLHESNDNSYLLAICKFWWRRQKTYLDSNRRQMHQYLKELNWPGFSIKYSIMFISQMILISNYSYAREILEDVYTFFERDKRNVRENLHKEFANLFELCLLYFGANQKIGFEKYSTMGSNGLFKDIRTEESGMIIKDASVNLFEYLLFSKNLELNSTVDYALEHSQNMCYQLLTENCFVLDKDLEADVGKLLMKTSTVAASTACTELYLCQLKSIGQLYNCLKMYCYFRASIPANFFSQIILRLHHEFYPKIDTASKNQYWGKQSKSPLPYFDITRRLKDNVYVDWSKVFVETFRKENGPALLVHHLEYYSALPQIPLEAEYLFVFILCMAFSFNCAQEFVRIDGFMTSLQVITNKSLQVKHYGKDRNLLRQFFCLMSWFGIFGNNETFKDNAGQRWSMRVVKDELKDYIQRLDKLPNYKTNVLRRLWWMRKEILESFVNGLHDTTDEDQEVLKYADCLLRRFK